MNNLLVIGGTEQEGTSRLLEMEGDLENPDQSIQEAFQQCLLECKDLKELSSLLVHLSNYGVNIIGSRGYLYSSKGQSIIIHDRCWPTNHLTRSLGIRDKYIELHKKESH